MNIAVLDRPAAAVAASWAVDDAWPRDAFCRWLRRLPDVWLGDIVASAGRAFSLGNLPRSATTAQIEQEVCWRALHANLARWLRRLPVDQRADMLAMAKAECQFRREVRAVIREDTRHPHSRAARIIDQLESLGQ